MKERIGSGRSFWTLGLACTLGLLGCASPAPVATAPEVASTPAPVRQAPPATSPSAAPIQEAPPPIEARASIVQTLAGDGTAGLGDAEDATTGRLNAPTGIAIVRGDTYIADSLNHCLRRLSYDGALSTVIGTGVRGYNGDGANGRSLQLDTPYKVAVDEATGNVFFSEMGNHLVRCIDISGRVLTVAGGGSYLPEHGVSLRGVDVQLQAPTGLCFDIRGQIYVAERGANRIIRLSYDWSATVMAGKGTAGDSGDGMEADLAEFNAPTDVAIDSQENLYIADTGNHKIRRISPEGFVSTVAGTGIAGYSGDGGPGTQAQLDTPTGLATDIEGNLYIADSKNHRIRQLRPDGTIVTLAGGAFGGFGGDGQAPAEARFNVPTGLTVSPEGMLKVADRDNHRIRSFNLP